MSPNEKNSVVTEQGNDLGLNKTTQDSLNLEAAKDPKKLKERITDLLKRDTEFSKMKQGDKILVVSAASGLFTAVLPLLAVGATLAIPGAIVGLALYFAVKVAVKTVQSGYKGLKWSAEKTVDGAKYTAEKVRDGAVHVKDKVKEGYERSVDSLKKGANFVGEGVANKFHKASGETDYLDKVKRFTPDAIKKSDEIRNDMKAIFADKGNNSGLVKNILSGMLSKIDLKIEEKIKLGETDQALEQLLVQGKFISDLSEKSLHSLLTERSLPKGSYFIDSVFSEHHDEIKRIIGECKREYEFDQSVRRDNAKDVEERKASKSFSLPSFSLLGRKGSEQSNSLSRSNSLNSVKTDSTVSSEAELLNPAKHKEVEQSSGFFSRFKRNEPLKEATDIKYQAFSGPDTSSRQVGESTFYVAPPKPLRSNSLNSIGTESTATVSSSGSKDFATVRRSNSSNILNASPKLTPVAPPKVSGSPSTDSGFNSPSGSPTYTMFTNKDGTLKTQADLRDTGYLDKLVGQPSTKVAVDTDVQQQAAKTAVKTN